VNDFEILRQVLEFYEGEYKGSADAAIARIEAEVEGAKEHHELHHAEVERLRSDNEQHLKQWTQDVERLRAENRLLQAEVDGAPLGWHSKEEA
jgi:predicted RNase H-like nuclease (RuvC/YqgF family)